MSGCGRSLEEIKGALYERHFKKLPRKTQRLLKRVNGSKFTCLMISPRSTSAYLTTETHTQCHGGSQIVVNIKNKRFLINQTLQTQDKAVCRAGVT